MLKNMLRYHSPFLLALILGAMIGGSQLYANRPVAAGKNTNVGGAFVCDCTNSENSCSCLL